MNWEKTIVKVILTWLPFAFVISSFTGLIYVTVQQNYRQQANDPQIQMAQDIANDYAQNKKSLSLDNLPKESVDISKSLSPFVIIFNSDFKAVYSTATLNGKIPSPPVGTFLAAKAYSEDRFTWQPQPATRLATVIDKYKSNQEEGYILVGRSLREIEIREDQTLFFCIAIWGISVVGTFIVIFLEQIIHHHKSE